MINASTCLYQIWLVKGVRRQTHLTSLKRGKKPLDLVMGFPAHQELHIRTALIQRRLGDGAKA